MSIAKGLRRLTASQERILELAGPVTPVPRINANGSVTVAPLPVQPSNAPPLTPERPAALVKQSRTKLRGPGRISLASNQEHPVPASAERAGALITNQSTTAWLTIMNDKRDKIFDIPPSQALAIPSNDAFTILNDGTGSAITLNLCLVDYD